jgi:hypothetical protein
MPDDHCDTGTYLPMTRASSTDLAGGSPTRSGGGYLRLSSVSIAVGSDWQRVGHARRYATRPPAQRSARGLAGVRVVNLS